MSSTCERCGQPDGYWHGEADCTAVATLRADLARVTAERDAAVSAKCNLAADLGQERQRAETAERELAATKSWHANALKELETAEHELAEARAHHDGYRVTAQEAIDQARARVSELEGQIARVEKPCGCVEERGEFVAWCVDDSCFHYP